MSEAVPTPLPMPKITPIRKIAGIFGLTGFSNVLSGSMSVNHSPIYPFSIPVATFASIYFFMRSSYFACKLFLSESIAL